MLTRRPTTGYYAALRAAAARLWFIPFVYVASHEQFCAAICLLVEDYCDLAALSVCHSAVGRAHVAEGIAVGHEILGMDPPAH